jgi:hypothetical protein
MQAVGDSCGKRPGPPVRTLAIVFLLLLVSGCAGLEPRYAYVDSVASRSAEGMHRYLLLARPRGYGSAEEAPAYVRKRHEEFVNLAHQVLRQAGYQRVESADDAELVIGFDYGVEVTMGQVRSERTSTVEMVAFDWIAVRDSDERNAIWRTYAYMDGSSGGLGRVVPELLEALGPYAGRNTGGTVEIVLD